MENQNNSASSDAGKLVLRLSIGGLLLLHGIYKLVMGVTGMAPMLGAVGLPALVAYGVYVGEIAAPILIIFGWKTRIGALLIVFNMLFAIWLVFRDKLFTLKEQGGGWTIELEMLFLLGALAIFFLGAGRYSVSRGIGRWD